MPGSIKARAGEIRERVNERLAELVPGEDIAPQQLHKAMRYSLLGSGKRIRPVLTVVAATDLGSDEELSLDPACAIEMVHTASLILDDLPQMDDSTLRRGQPANHIVFGEDTALLAAVALLNCAYSAIASAPGLRSGLRLELISMLCKAMGTEGLVAGQMLDLEDWPGRDAESLQQTNGLKTAALFVLGAEAGARIAGVPEREVEAVRRFATDFGLAFQMFDDLLDVCHTEGEVGKNVLQDQGKATLVSLLGTERVRVLANQLLDAAHDHLDPLGARSQALGELARFFLPVGTVALDRRP